MEVKCGGTPRTASRTPKGLLGRTAERRARSGSFRYHPALSGVHAFVPANARGRVSCPRRGRDQQATALWSSPAGRRALYIVPSERSLVYGRLSAGVVKLRWPSARPLTDKVTHSCHRGAPSDTEVAFGPGKWGARPCPVTLVASPSTGGTVSTGRGVHTASNGDVTLFTTLTPNSGVWLGDVRRTPGGAPAPPAGLHAGQTLSLGCHPPGG